MQRRAVRLLPCVELHRRGAVDLQITLSHINPMGRRRYAGMRKKASQLGRPLLLGLEHLPARPVHHDRGQLDRAQTQHISQVFTTPYRGSPPDDLSLTWNP